MRIATARWLAGGIAVAYVGLMTGGLVLAFLDRHLVPPSLTNWDFADAFADGEDLTIPVIAVILASRRPRNPIGWLGLAALGGRLEVESAPGAGTTVSGHLPVAQVERPG